MEVHDVCCLSQFCGTAIVPSLVVANFNWLLLSSLSVCLHLSLSLSHGMTHGSPTGVGSLTPRFDFVVASTDPTERNLTLAAVQIVCTTAETGAVVWDSGLFPSTKATGLLYGSGGGGGLGAGATGGSSAAAATPLIAGRRYVWTARWMSADGRTSAASAPASFDLALLEEEDWQGAKWLGAGQREFKTTLDLAHLPTASAGTPPTVVATAHICSPGGAVSTCCQRSLVCALSL
jgi:hypothetical protein